MPPLNLTSSIVGEKSETATHSEVTFSGKESSQ